MIKAISLNIKTFKRKKTFKNYMFLNTIICILMFVVLLIQAYVCEQVKSIINNSENRLIFIHNVEKSDLINNFFDENKEKIENVVYNISIIDYKINDKIYRIETNEKEQESDILISSNNRGNSIKIENIDVNNIAYSDDLEDNLILINQRISKVLVENYSNAEKMISFYVNDYYDIESMIEKLEKKGIDCNANDVHLDEVETYNSVNKIMSIIFIFFIGVVIVLMAILNINFLCEQKKDIMIYNNLGYDRFKVLKIYMCTFSYYLIIAYLYSLIIVSLFVGLLALSNLLIFKAFLSCMSLPILVMLVIDLLVLLGIFIVKKDYYY